MDADVEGTLAANADLLCGVVVSVEGQGGYSCGHHHPLERDPPEMKGILANPLKSRWGHQ